MNTKQKVKRVPLQDASYFNPDHDERDEDNQNQDVDQQSH